MRLVYINNDASGFADHVEAPDGATVQQFFQEKMPTADPANYLIRVNRQHVTRDQVLQENDRISITAKRIAGA